MLLAAHPLVGFDDLAHQIVTHDVDMGEADVTDARDRLEQPDRVAKPRFLSRRKVGLGRIAVDHHPRPLAEAGQEHLHLHRGRVLRLVEKDRGLGERPPAHERERRDLDHAGLKAAFDHPPVHEVVERVIDRAQVGIDLVAHVAGQEAEPLAGLDRGARQHQPLDQTLLEERDGMADRKPGLAGAGGTFGEHQLMLAQRSEIVILGGAAGANDAALARLDDAEALLRRVVAGEQEPLIGALGDDALDVAFARRLTELHSLVEHLEHPARLLARLARTLDDDLIAVGVGRDAETALDAGDILIVVAEHHRSGGVVGEGDGDFGRFGLRGASD